MERRCKEAADGCGAPLMATSRRPFLDPEFRVDELREASGETQMAKAVSDSCLADRGIEILPSRRFNDLVNLLDGRRPHLGGAGCSGTCIFGSKVLHMARSLRPRPTLGPHRVVSLVGACPSRGRSEVQQRRGEGEIGRRACPPGPRSMMIRTRVVVQGGVEASNSRDLWYSTVPIDLLQVRNRHTTGGQAAWVSGHNETKCCPEEEIGSVPSQTHTTHPAPTLSPSIIPKIECQRSRLSSCNSKAPWHQSGRFSDGVFWGPGQSEPGSGYDQRCILGEI